MLDHLLTPTCLGALWCRTRVVMSPCTRCRSPGFVPTEEVARYYARRAADGVGLLITEGTAISQRANGYPNVPGIFDPEQEDGWRRVCQAVHEVGGLIACQLWHVGSFSHPLLTGGSAPEGPSGISPPGMMKQIRSADGARIPYGEAEPMSEARIHEVVEEFGRAAERARRANFDAVEIHGAHGYLVDQFINPYWNRRQDAWGPSAGFRFVCDVVARVLSVWGPGRTILRISPAKAVGGPVWPEPGRMLAELLDALDHVGLRILDLSTEAYDEPLIPRDGQTITAHEFVRDRWPGEVIGVGALTPRRADEAIARGEIDAAAFGRSLIANPDFVTRVREHTELRAYHPSQLLQLD